MDVSPLSLLDAEITRLRAERDAIDAQLAEAEAARRVLARLTGRAAPAPEAPPPGKGKPGRQPANRDLPLQLARLLLDGPKANADLARLSGSGEGVTHRCLKQRPGLFRKLSRARKAPWELTPEGRKAAAAPSPGA